MLSVSRFIEGKLFLKVNKDKSVTARDNWINAVC